MVVDRNLLHRLLRDIEANVTLLEGARKESQKDLFADPLRAYGVQHALQIAIEASIGAAHHLIAECGFPTPERNVDIVAILARQGVIGNPDLANRLSRMVRFRNLLVHRYWVVDAAIVYEILHNNLDDLRQFSQEVNRYLERNPNA